MKVFAKHQLPHSGLGIVIAGGVTGGHLFPGIAVAQEFMSRNPANRILFISIGNAMEREVLAQNGFSLATISASGIKGRGKRRQIISGLSIPAGIISALRHLLRFKPDLVIGMGGYSAGPVAVAAWLMGIRVVIHEQNLLPGITNRLLCRISSRIYVSFEQSADRFDKRKVRLSGNPVRREFVRNSENGHAAGAAMLEAKNRFVVLIIGGSQGAHSINMAILDALDHIGNPDLYYFIHQTGRGDAEAMKKAYMEKGFDADVRPFFTDMARYYAYADLVVCRSGATTVAEIAALGKGAIFIPFPHAADNHQALNARSMVDVGAAEMILENVLEGKLLARRIEHYAAHPDALARMGAMARQHGNPHAATYIVDDCCTLFGHGSE